LNNNKLTSLDKGVFFSILQTFSSFDAGFIDVGSSEFQFSNFFYLIDLFC